MPPTRHRRRNRPRGVTLSTTVVISLAISLAVALAGGFYLYLCLVNEVEAYRQSLTIIQGRMAQADIEIQVERRALTQLEQRLEALQRRLAILNVLERFSDRLDDGLRLDLAAAIDEEATNYGCDPMFLVALMKIESSLNPEALSPKGARGLMQLMPATGAGLMDEFDQKLEPEYLEQLGILTDGPHSLDDPVNNLRLGTYYLARLALDLGDKSSPQAVLTAYNMGITRLNKRLDSGGSLPSGYARRVARAYRKLLEEQRDQEEAPHGVAPQAAGIPAPATPTSLNALVLPPLDPDRSQP